MRRHLSSLALIFISLLLAAALTSCDNSAKAISNEDNSGLIGNHLGMEFVEIPAGSFLMGSPPEQAGHEPDEVQHGVTISQHFYLQTTEVTRKQWLAIADGSPSAFADCGLDCPVDRLRYEWIQFYISKLNEQDQHYRYRLPTEAEWEYAARAGSKSPFYSGDCLSADQANVSGQVALPGCEAFSSSESPMPVKSFPPNPWGLYDMHGNAWEMVQDWYGDYPSNDAIDPAGPEDGEYKVLRGGSWRFYPTFVRSANRFKSIRDIAGFRLVLEKKIPAADDEATTQ